MVSSKKVCTFAPDFEREIDPAEIAQLVEHDLAKVGVASSSLVFRSRRKFIEVMTLRKGSPKGENAEIAQLVEHDLAKVGVASSSLVFRSELVSQPQALVVEW